MRSWTIAFLCGIVSLNFFAQLPSPLWLVAPLIIALLFAHFTSKPYTKLFHLTIAFMLGFLWVLLFAQWQTATTLPEHWQGKNLTAVGVIASLPEKQTLNKYLKYAKFNFDISQLRFGKQNIKHPIRVRLSWYNRYPKNLKVGDEWQLQIRLKRPHGYANPGSFNFEKWAFSHRIQALGYVINKGNNHLIASHFYSHPIDVESDNDSGSRWGIGHIVDRRLE